MANTKAKSKKKEKDTFVLDSRLNKTQRKFCSCLMKVRTSINKRNKNKKKKTALKVAYPICYKSIKKKYISENMSRKKNKYKPRTFEKTIKMKKLNCLFNYDFNKYDLEDLQLMAKEKGIKTSYKKNGKTLKYTKTQLLRKMRTKYFNKYVYKI